MTDKLNDSSTLGAVYRQIQSRWIGPCVGDFEVFVIAFAVSEGFGAVGFEGLLGFDDVVGEGGDGDGVVVAVRVGWGFEVAAGTELAMASSLRTVSSPIARSSFN